MSSSSLRPEPAVVEAPLLQSVYNQSAAPLAYVILMKLASRLRFVLRCDAATMRRRCDRADGAEEAEEAEEGSEDGEEEVEEEVGEDEEDGGGEEGGGNGGQGSGSRSGGKKTR